MNIMPSEARLQILVSNGDLTVIALLSMAITNVLQYHNKVLGTSHVGSLVFRKHSIRRVVLRVDGENGDCFDFVTVFLLWESVFLRVSL